MVDMATRSNTAGRAVPPQPEGTPGLVAHSDVAPPRRPGLGVALRRRAWLCATHSRRRGHVRVC